MPTWTNATPIALSLFAAAAIVSQPVAGQTLTVDAASSHLKSLEGKKVGTVALRQTPNNGVLLNVSLDGLKPGNYAFHIHETGKCEGDFKSAGGHFDPEGKKHGVLAEGGPHAGDLPNVHVPPEGRVNLEMFARSVTLEKGSNSLFDADGSAIVLHRGIDDYKSQPSGNAGERIACGVVTNTIIDANPR